MQGAPPADGELALLAGRVLAGDAAAEEAIARRFHDRIRLMVLARTHDGELARDLAQETTIAVLTALRRGQVRDPDRLGAYVHGVAKNLLNNHIRAHRQQPPEEPLPLEVPAAGAPDEVEASQRFDLVRRALARLVPIDRRVLLMTLVDGLKPGEIAFQLGLSAEVVRARKSRALKKVVERVDALSRNRR
jgi:RNA polymerase sigma-70 factor (ECF subfamily)